MADKQDIYERITSAIVTAIESGAGKWRMPWHSDGTVAFSPISIRGRKPYRGINTVMLWGAAQQKGYPSALWGTYDAWQEAGGQVRKGEKSTSVVFWGRCNGQDEDEDSEHVRLFCKGYSVFNAAQVDGFVDDSVAAPKLPKWKLAEQAEEFFASTGADIRHGGNQAFYTTDGDYIRIPQRSQFDAADGYYSTLAHECGHWTGHASRLSREFGKRFGDNAYAVEELVAELTAAFTMGRLELANEPRPDHACYLASWLRVLKADKRAIFTAASQAQKAADFLATRNVREAVAA